VSNHNRIRRKLFRLGLTQRQLGVKVSGRPLALAIKHPTFRREVWNICQNVEPTAVPGYLTLVAQLFDQRKVNDESSNPTSEAAQADPGARAETGEAAVPPG